MDDLVADGVETVVDLIPTKHQPSERHSLISQMDEWLTANKLTNVKHVFQQHNIELNELSKMTDTEIIRFATENQFDTITTIRFKDACSKLDNISRMKASQKSDPYPESKKQSFSLPGMPLSWKLLICALIALYDIIGDIGMPFSFPWVECECYIGDCEQSYSKHPDISSICCNSFVKTTKGQDCNAACGTQIDFEGDTDDAWYYCDHYPYEACADYCHSPLFMLALMTMVITLIKEFFKLVFTVQLLWNDHLEDIKCRKCCEKECCRLDTIAIWCKDSVLFFLVVLIKPSILKEMKQIDEEVGLDHQRVIFINLLMEDLWGILVALLIMIVIQATFWSVFSLIGSILMVSRQLYVVRQVNMRKMKVEEQEIA